MNKWLMIGILLLLLYVVGSIVAIFAFKDDGVSFGNKIVIVPLEGVISTQSEGSVFGGSTGISSTQIVKVIQDLDKDASVKGVIFSIDSPGGAAVASQEIGDAIKKMNKTNYAVIREIGASGGYWIASSTDKIIASPLSITGSIGVIASYLEFSELFGKYGIGYERLIAGKYKDLGIPYKNLTNEERQLLQSKLNKIHEYFIQEVAINRKMDVSKVRDLATGEFYLGSEALDLGLIDQFGNVDTAVELIKLDLNLTDVGVVEHREELGLLDILSGQVAYQFGRGFGNSLIEYDLNNKFNIRT